MANADLRLGRDPAFDDFLGAAVGEDPGGRNVTVLSMLARLGVDPWGEASDLDAMPEVPARQRLEALLTRFEDVPTGASDRGRVATALLAFLPHRAAAARPFTKTAAGLVTLPRFGAPIYWIAAALLVLGWVATMGQVN